MIMRGTELLEQWELDEYLGDVEVTEEQRERMLSAWKRVIARYPLRSEDGEGDDFREEREQAFTTAVQMILGESTLADRLADWQEKRAAERAAMASLTGAIIAARASMSENAIAAATGLNRGTVRKALAS